MLLNHNYMKLLMEPDEDSIPTPFEDDLSMADASKTNLRRQHLSEYMQKVTIQSPKAKKAVIDLKEAHDAEVDRLNKIRIKSNLYKPDLTISLDTAV